MSDISKKWKLRQPPPLCLQEGDAGAGENYLIFKQRFEIYLTATSAKSKLDEEGKIALYLHCIGEDSLDIYNNFEWEQDIQKTFDLVVQKFDAYFLPLKNETINRNVFFTRKRSETETFDEYLNALRTLSADCNFGTLRESLIKDQIVIGLKRKNIVARLQKQPDLDLPKCIAICKSFEITEKTIDNFETEGSKIDAMKKKYEQKEKGSHKDKASTSNKERENTSKGFTRTEKKKKEMICGRCGYHHGIKRPAYGQLCAKCKKYGHYAKMCPNKVCQVQQQHSDTDRSDSFLLGADHQVQGIKTEMHEAVKIGQKNEEKLVDFKLDTGSDCVKKLQIEHKLDKNFNSLYNYDGTKINCIGGKANIFAQKMEKNVEEVPGHQARKKEKKPPDQMIARNRKRKEKHCRLATGGGPPSTSSAKIETDESQVAPALIVGIDKAIDTDTISGATLYSHNSLHNSANKHIFHPSMHQIGISQPTNTTTTPISLLIQSLVKLYCTLLEKDLSRSNTLYNAICEKLRSMNLIDDSYAMAEFEAMRSQYQRALYQLVTVANGSEIPTITLPASWPIVQPSGLEWSRYHKEFEELYFIAGGGFGSVFKARHRLDGVEYAVKKVYIQSSDVNSIMSHLSEVKTIASLNHPNIVSYKTAWLEYQMDVDSDDETLNSNIIFSAHPNIITSFKTSDSKELTKADFKISFKNSSSFENLDSSSDEPDLQWATLYIQMTFCQQTLKQWLDERNNAMSVSRKNAYELMLHQLHHCDSNDSACLDSPINPDMNYPVALTHIDLLMDMFTQLVRGLHYIHSRGVIHHDIKPSNVFVARNENGLLVQLGDFGLACPLQQSHSGSALGTHLYAAPEQLEGQCNPKSDMYSLGIILLEMVEPFGTDMERVKTITNLRKGQIPAHLTANYPKIAHIIGKLVQRRPGKRLDTGQLLEELKNFAENKDDTIKSLEEELAAKNDEIAQLKMMLANLSCKSYF